MKYWSVFVYTTVWLQEFWQFSFVHSFQWYPNASSSLESLPNILYLHFFHQNHCFYFFSESSKKKLMITTNSAWTALEIKFSAKNWWPIKKNENSTNMIDIPPTTNSAKFITSDLSHAWYEKYSEDVTENKNASINIEVKIGKAQNGSVIIPIITHRVWCTAIKQPG